MKFRDTLNQNLLRDNKVTDDQIKNLEVIYGKIDILFQQAEVLFEQADGENIKTELSKFLADELKLLEFELQENWNFPKDEKYHTWWNRFKGCTCPKMDNDERFGYDKIISEDCPFHGFIKD